MANIPTSLPDAAISFPMFGNLTINPGTELPIPGLHIHWYGLIIAIGFLLAVIYAYRRAPKFGLSGDELIDVLLLAVPLGVVGARLYYCLTFLDANGVNPYFQDPISILYIWNGGLAIYGGVIGAFIGLCIVCRYKHFSIGAALDTCCFGLLIGQCIGRWGNFFNREAFGWTEHVDQLFCRMGLTVPGQETIYVHPTFLYESLWNLVGFLLLHFFSKKHKRAFDGQFFCTYLAWYGLGRFLIEGLRTDSLTIGPFRISQLLALVTLAVGLIVIVVGVRRQKRNPQPLWVERRQGASAFKIVKNDTGAPLDK